MGGTSAHAANVRVGKAALFTVGSAAMKPFWKTKSLEQMTTQEWESLCDGCGRCCLHKLRHEETNELSFTNVACRLLDLESCQCSDYARRQRRVPDCVSLTPAALLEIDWLPPSCAYRRIRDGRDLAWWHPLVSGDPNTVHQAGVSVRGRAISERRAGALENHIEEWPGKPPRIRRPTADEIPKNSETKEPV
jgi:uncharacterized cysteine cluster protein YcgN (CxxCxxCC family)